MPIKRKKMLMLDLGKVDEGASKASKGAAESKKSPFCRICRRQPTGILRIFIFTQYPVFFFTVNLFCFFSLFFFASENRLLGPVRKQNRGLKNISRECLCQSQNYWCVPR